MKQHKRNKSALTPRQRSFHGEFRMGDEVSVIRHEHGWENGLVTGRIIFMTSYSATVEDFDGNKYHIEHPRDISKVI